MLEQIKEQVEAGKVSRDEAIEIVVLLMTRYEITGQTFVVRLNECYREKEKAVRAIKRKIMQG